MFTPPPASGYDVGESGARERSRTPCGADPVPAWSTGNPVCDEWFAKQGVAPDVVLNFSMMPQQNRKRIVLGMMDKMPDNIDAWISGCHKRWRTSELEWRLTGGAGPQRGRMTGADAPSAPASGSYARPEVPILHHQAAVGQPVFSREPTQACLDLLKYWPDDKSGMIAAVVDNLQDAVLERFLELDTQDQSALAFACMLTCPEQKSQWQGHIDVLLDRYLRARGSGAPDPLIVHRSPKAESASLDVQFIFGGFSSVMAATLVTVLQKSIRLMHRKITWTFQPVLFLRDGTDMDHKIAAQTLQEHQANFAESVDDLKSLQNNWASLADKWKTNGTKIIFLANIGCDANPEKFLEDIPANYLHLPANKWTWMFLQASKCARAEVQEENVADIIFAPPTDVLRDELNQMWGEENQMRESTMDKVSPLIPRVHSTPAKFGVAPCLMTDGDSVTVGAGDAAPDLTPLLRTQRNFRVRPWTVAKLLVTRTFKERPLTRDEVDLLDKYQRDKNGAISHASREHFLQWFGLAGTVAESIFKKELPCFEFVLKTTGKKIERGGKFATACGQDRYCRNCEQVFTMLDSGYGLASFGDVVLAMITKALPTWAGVEKATWEWQRSEQANKPHDCKAGCTGLH